MQRDTTLLKFIKMYNFSNLLIMKEDDIESLIKRSLEIANNDYYKEYYGSNSCLILGLNFKKVLLSLGTII